MKDYYTIGTRGAGVGPGGERARIFLLGDYHGDKKYTHINSTFVNTFAGERDMVLIEGHPSMIPLEDPTKHFMSSRLETKAPIVGWDYDKLPELHSRGLDEAAAKVYSLIGRYLKADRGEKKDLKREIVKASFTHLRLISIEPKSTVDPYAFNNERTEALISSILSVSQKAEAIFVFAGKAHLEVMPKGFWENETNNLLFSEAVSKLHQAIAHLPFVVLEPRQDCTSAALQEEEDLLGEINGIPHDPDTGDPCSIC